jgi:hypothetical protein
LESFVKTAENWVGKLTAAQRELIAARLAALQPTSCGWVENRIRVRRSFSELLDRSGTDPAWPAELRRLLTSPEERWDPDYRLAFEANRDAIVALLTELDATLTQRQRAQLSEKLTGYARDFRDLAARPATPATARN